jgi:hypothetical protein
MRKTDPPSEPSLQSYDRDPIFLGAEFPARDRAGRWRCRSFLEKLLILIASGCVAVSFSVKEEVIVDGPGVTCIFHQGLGEVRCESFNVADIRKIEVKKPGKTWNVWADLQISFNSGKAVVMRVPAITREKSKAEFEEGLKKGAYYSMTRPFRMLLYVGGAFFLLGIMEHRRAGRYEAWFKATMRPSRPVIEEEWRPENNGKETGGADHSRFDGFL